VFKVNVNAFQVLKVLTVPKPKLVQVLKALVIITVSVSGVFALVNQVMKEMIVAWWHSKLLIVLITVPTTESAILANASVLTVSVDRIVLSKLIRLVLTLVNLLTCQLMAR
jgi:lysophospholipid acyltransferase (LPLAT)-like uncharacterized protein